MNSLPRRTIDELVARYELEPELRDIYVEGHLDRSIIDWFLSRKNISDVKVYEIDTIEVPAELVEEKSVATGNKGRVIALCCELQDRIRRTLSVMCVIDRDFDHILDNICTCK